MIKGMTWRRGFAMVAGMALAVAALPGVVAAQDDEIVVMTYFGAELGGPALEDKTREQMEADGKDRFEIQEALMPFELQPYYKVKNGRFGE